MQRLNTTLSGSSDSLDKMEVKDVEAKKGKNDVEKHFNHTTKKEAQQQETTQPQEHTYEQLLRHPVDRAHVLIRGCNAVVPGQELHQQPV